MDIHKYLGNLMLSRCFCKLMQKFWEATEAIACTGAVVPYWDRCCWPECMSCVQHISTHSWGSVIGVNNSPSESNYNTLSQKGMELQLEEMALTVTFDTWIVGT